MPLLNPANILATPLIQNNRDPVVRSTAYGIRRYFHNATNTPHCDEPCELCLNAARLVIMDVAPRIAAEVLEKIHSALGYHCALPHPGDD